MFDWQNASDIGQSGGRAAIAITTSCSPSIAPSRAITGIPAKRSEFARMYD
jgi:hypothetical protein